MATYYWKKLEWMKLNQSLLQRLLCPIKMEGDSHSILMFYASIKWCIHKKY